LLSADEGDVLVELTEEHKPTNRKEFSRVIENGGSIYQSEVPEIAEKNIKFVIDNKLNKISNGVGPYRIVPGHLIVFYIIYSIFKRLQDYSGLFGLSIPSLEDHR